MTDGCAGALGVWEQGWRWGYRRAGIFVESWTSIFIRYEPFQVEFGRDIEWDRHLRSQEFMDYALFKSFAPSDPDIDGLRKWIIPTQPRKRSRLWSESHDPLPAMFQYTSQTPIDWIV